MTPLSPEEFLLIAQQHCAARGARLTELRQQVLGLVLARGGERVGVVDVGEVYRQKEAEFTQLLTRATTDADREKAFALARSFSQRLPAALEELPRDCACLVVLKSAVAGRTPRTVDLTALLQQKLGHPQTPHRNDPEEAR